MGARGEALNRWEACVACDSALGEARILPLSPAPHLGRTPSLRTGMAHRPLSLLGITWNRTPHPCAHKEQHGP